MPVPCMVTVCDRFIDSICSDLRAPVYRLVSGMVLAETMNPVSRWGSNLDSNKACNTDYTKEQLCGYINVPVSALCLGACVFIVCLCLHGM